MPFTFVHPAIVLPLEKFKRLSLTGLITGAITPDFEYFIRMHISSIYSHTLLGMFWFDVPLGVLLAFIFHNIVRDSFFDNLPAALNTRLSRYKQFNWNRYFIDHWLMVLISVLIGAFSHLFLDSFTHPHGFFVKQVPGILNKNIVGHIPLFKILQHSFTLISSGYIVYYFRKIPATSAPLKPNIKYWLSITALSLVILILRFLILPDYHIPANVVVSGISAFLLAIIITPLFSSAKKRTQTI